MSYEAVLDLLAGPQNWGVCRSAYPDRGAVEDALAAGQSPSTIANSLSAFAKRAPDPPIGYRDRTDSGIWAYKLLVTFGSKSHFRPLNTRQALGLEALDPVQPSIPQARTAEDAIEAAIHGWHYTGDSKFLDVDTPEGKAEFDRRSEFAKTPPLSWVDVDSTLYWLLIIYNRLPSVFPPFGVRVSELHRNVYGLNVQKWLDNEWSQRDLLPTPWKPDGSRNPEADAKVADKPKAKSA